MAKTIKIDADDMEEIMANMPPRIRKKIEASIKELSRPDDGISIVRHFVDQYDPENHIDSVVSFSCANIIKALTVTAINIVKQKGEAGITGASMAMIVSKCFREEADKIEEAIASHIEDSLCNCTKH